VDCGATAHIVYDQNNFIRFDRNFDTSKHFIELADGTRSNGIVSARGDGSIVIHDVHSEKCDSSHKKPLSFV